MHQCEKGELRLIDYKRILSYLFPKSQNKTSGGAINSQTCVEYCRYPIKKTENGYSQILQIQNYFAMKDDGQYTCKIHYDEEVLALNKTLKFIQRKIQIFRLRQAASF